MAERASLPPLPQPYPHLRVGHLGAQPLPEGVATAGIGTAVDLTGAEIEHELAQGLDVVILGTEPQGSTGPGAASSITAQDPQTFDAHSLEVLIACEAAGVPTVLRVAGQTDLHTPVAAVVSHMAAETPVLYEESLQLVGQERAFLIQPAANPAEILTETAESTEQRRRALATRSPQALADQFLGFLGLPVEPQPLVTALIISRHAKNLHHSLQNLKRQDYPRVDPLLVIDPLYEQDAREITAEWDIPVRIVTANPRSTPADKLNVGTQHAYGEILAVIEETGLYGSHYLTDQVQALQHSGAHLVGKASWYVWNAERAKPTVHAAAKQRSFDHVPVLGTLALHRQTARALGFTRRVSSVEGALARRIREAGGSVYVGEAAGTLLLRRGQVLEDFAEEALASGDSF